MRTQTMTDAIHRFLDMPLWLSIPCTVIYLGAVVWYIYTMYHFSDWRQRRRNNKQQKK
ncbi:MAG: hypothetical protein IJK43_14545 [Prevotella sp.]|nr:hypothetical protein [Prevotella sp.]